MKQVYLFLFTITLFVVACAPKASQDSATTTNTATTKAVNGTEVLKDGIPSPLKRMSFSKNDAKIVVQYGSPSVKGRTVWGDLVPFDEVWRTGANEATTFETSTALTVQGKELPAGKYGLFTIPTEDGKWTVIFNSVHEQWGAYEYDKSKDVLRVNATAVNTETVTEAMEFALEGTNIVLKWDKLTLPIKVSL